MFGIPYLKQDWIDRAATLALDWDLRGHRFHIFFGLFWCLLVAGPITIVEAAGVGLAVTSLARAYFIFRTWKSFACHPQVWAFVAWILWQASSISWSFNPSHGLVELSKNRWCWSVWFLWTILPRRPWLIVAVVIGFLGANVGQLVQGLAVHYHIQSLQFPRMPDRNAAWWQPVVGGSMLCAALGLHLPAAAMGSGRQRWFGLGGSVITLVGIFATGTRGAWIGAAGLIGVVATIATIRLLKRGRGERRSRKRIGLLAAALVISLGLAWAFAGDSIMRRYHAGRDEVIRAIDGRDYASDTGARIFMWKWAIEEIKAHPFRGVGAGGYASWAKAEMHKRGEDQNFAILHPHAHSTYLHIVATTGLVGLGLWGLTIGLAIWGGFKGLGDRMGTYAAGPAFAIIGLLMAGFFDVVQLNIQTCAMLAVMVSLTIWPRPKEPGSLALRGATAA